MTPEQLRVQTLEGLLRLIGDGLVSGSRDGIRGGEGSLPLLPHADRCLLRLDAARRCTCWVRSVTEVERCLRLMRQEHRPLWYALHERYIAATRRGERVPFKRGRPALPPNARVLHGWRTEFDLNTHGTGHALVLVERWRPTIDPARVDEGLRVLSVLFRGEPSMPTEMLEKKGVA